MKRFFAGLAAATVALGAAAQTQPPAPGAEPRRVSSSGSAAARAGGALECLLEPSLVANVGSPVDGILDQVLVDRGDHVRKGQVVARLQSGVEAAQVKVSEARVEYSRRKVERNEALFAQQLISAQERDEMVTEMLLNQEELKRNQESLRLRTIVSPLDGVVVERRMAPGESIRTDKSVVFKLAQINPLHVEVIAPAELFGSLRSGVAGSVNLEPFVPGTHKARVTVVDKLIDAASGTLGVRLQLPNPNNRIPAGIKCSVVFGK
ncbi:MAG: efflux RND transporter periplasmic adaptor subunit [Burkholderiales bacterium]|nr:efflux RND transporter periplasmic adaptor subunit [Burkholderiales bacterium]